MGYNTILSRIFIKVDEERFVPYVNTRVSNCTTISDKGREVRAQENFPLYIKRRNVATLQDVQEWIDETVEQKIECNKNYDWADKTEKDIRANLGWNVTFYLSGKRNMSDKQIYNWFKSGFKNGYTIEELKEIYPSLLVYLNDYESKDAVYVNSTDELIAVLDNTKYDNYQLYISAYEYVLKAIQRKNKLEKYTKQKKENVPVSEYYYVEDNGVFFYTSRRKVGIVYESQNAKKFKHKSQAELFAKRLRERYGRKTAEVKKKELNKPQLIIF